MLTSKTKKLVDELDPQTDKFTYTVAMLVIKNCMGAHSERMHNPAVAEGIWQEVNLLAGGLIESDPEQALLTGLQLAILKTSPEQQQEWAYRYLRGVGLTILADTRIAPQLRYKPGSGLESYVPPLLHLMAELITSSAIDGFLKEQAFSTPEFYARMIATLVAINMNGVQILPITQLAYKRLAQEHFRAQVKWYLEIADTRELAEILLTASEPGSDEPEM